MKNRLTLLIAIAAMMVAPLAKAQTPESPAKYKLEKDADYAQYEGKVKDDVAWYIKNSVDKDTALRRQIAAFLVKWISGASNVSVSLGKTVNPIVYGKHKYNGDMLVAYMGGIAVYELTHPNDKDEVNIEMAGLKAILELAKNNPAQFADSDAVKKYKAMNEGTMPDYVKDCIAKDKE